MRPCAGEIRPGPIFVCAERRRHSEDRRDREPGRPEPRDHLLLLAARRSLRGADRRGRELVHLRDVGLETGGSDNPGRGPARAPGAQARRRPLAAASDRDALAPAAAPRPFPARDADWAPDGCATHAVRRLRVCQRRRRARQPQGLRGDRAPVRRLSPRQPAGPETRRPAGWPAPAEPGIRPLRARPARTRSQATRRARPAREPRDRPPRADALAAGDPRGTRRRVHHAAGPGTASARGAVSFGDALVAGRTASGCHRDRRPCARNSASCKQTRAR